MKGSPLTLSMESIYAYENKNCEVLHIPYMYLYNVQYIHSSGRPLRSEERHRSTLAIEAKSRKLQFYIAS